ncbi:MAG: magnesium transporter [Deltaproteobacteria bacterium]|nr:magnesium transporter [Deltaproteobacteria bacterium]
MTPQPEQEQERLSTVQLGERWSILPPEERVQGFQMMDRSEADAFFQSRTPHGQATIVMGVPRAERRLWMRLLEPDDAADLLQEVPEEARPELMQLLDEPTRREVSALLAYAEDEAGGLMSPRFARIRPDMTVDEAISYLRRQARNSLETLYYAYVLDREQRLLGVVSFRELFTAHPGQPIREVMHTDVITVPETMDQEIVSRIVSEYDFVALPVVDADGHMKGIITFDDVIDVVEEEATEDIHKLGGMAALEVPYLQTGFLPMLKKRVGWLSLLFVGEMFTAAAMGHYEDEIARAVVLALFIPLIISSGGNSGSQASTLVIRAMALGEIRLRDWWHIMRREVLSGLSQGVILSLIAICMVGVLFWQGVFQSHDHHVFLIAATVASSVIGVVLWGTVAGSMLPFVLRTVRLDPASASAPLIATLVDVSGLVIYFSMARVILHGVLL